VAAAEPGEEAGRDSGLVMTWASFWHWLVTSRYTRRLEAEIEYALKDNERLRADNHELLCALHPALRSVRTESVAIKGLEAKRPMKPFNSF
jgi:hypothetical protein